MDGRTLTCTNQRLWGRNKFPRLLNYVLQTESLAKPRNHGELSKFLTFFPDSKIRFRILRSLLRQLLLCASALPSASSPSLVGLRDVHGHPLIHLLSHRLAAVWSSTALTSAWTCSVYTEFTTPLRSTSPGKSSMQLALSSLATPAPALLWWHFHTLRKLGISLSSL